MDLDKINQTASLNENNLVSLMIFKMSGLKEVRYGEQPLLALNIFKIKEVLNVADYRLKKMPANSDCFLGMIEVRGLYVPIYNLCKWLGYCDFDVERSVYIICEVNGRLIGVHTAHILGVNEIGWEEIVPAQTMSHKVVNQTMITGELCLIVDIEKMVNEISGLDLATLGQAKQVNFDQTKLVLYADDQGSMRDYLRAILTNMGFACKGFEHGGGIIDYLDTHGGDCVLLVITDLEMPHTSGHTVIKYIKQGRFGDIPVFVHSSMTVKDSERQAIQMGADAFLGKVDVNKLKKHLLPFAIHSSYQV